MESRPRKIDRVTQLVLDYKAHPNSDLLKEIYDSTKRLVWAVMEYYNLIRTFPLTVQEDIVEDCRSFVLFKSIEKFDISKGANFGTHYTWWCKSHVRARRNYYRIRPDMIRGISFESCEGKRACRKGTTPTSLTESLTKEHIEVFANVNKFMQDVFTGKAHFVRFPLGEILEELNNDCLVLIGGEKMGLSIFRVSVTLPDGTVKEFRTDEYNEEKILQRFYSKYGENNILVTRVSLDNAIPSVTV